MDQHQHLSLFFVNSTARHRESRPFETPNSTIFVSHHFDDVVHLRSANRMNGHHARRCGVTDDRCRKERFGFFVCCVRYAVPGYGLTFMFPVFGTTFSVVKRFIEKKNLYYFRYFDRYLLAEIRLCNIFFSLRRMFFL